jgi:hypothetical protein
MSIEQQGNALTFLGFFTESKVGKTGLTVTIDVYRNGTQIVTGGSATAVGGGLYSYTLTSGNVNAEGLYAAIFKTATTTVDQQHIPSLWVVGTGGIENLDAAVSSRNATTPPTVAAIRSEIDSNSTKLDAAVSTRATPAQVTTIVGAIAGGGGAVTYVQNVADSEDEPLDGVALTVRTTTNSAETPVATGTTDAFGNATFYLDPGTYYIWCQRGGINFTNPTQITVSA